MKNLMKLTVIMLFLAVVCNLLPTVYSYAEAPQRIINYQGRLTDKSGKPVADGSYAVTFRIFNVKNAGTSLWEESQTVNVEKGIFSAEIGGTKSLNLPFNEQYYLEVKVGQDNPMEPRQKITSAGYAIRAENAEKAATADKAITIEARSSDPSSPVPGQIWLRTDL